MSAEVRRGPTRVPLPIKGEFDTGLRLGEIAGAAAVVGAGFLAFGGLEGSPHWALFLAVLLAFLASFAFTLWVFTSPLFLLFPVVGMATIGITVAIARLVPGSLTRLLLQTGLLGAHALAVLGLVVIFQIS